MCKQCILVALDETNKSTTLSNIIKELKISHINKKAKPIKMSFAAQILQPGGGILLIPFIRSVIMCLFITTLTAFVVGVARVHMAILSLLAGGLLLSISFFMSEYEKAMENAKARARNGEAKEGASSTPQTSGAETERAKTD